MNSATRSSNAALSGIILFAHGSRDPMWKRPIEAVAAHIARARPDLPVQCAYLELCEPNLAQAAALMMRQLAPNTINSIAVSADGVSSEGLKHIKIRILPMFLGIGKHAREDLPELVEGLRQTYPQASFEVEAAVGENAQVIALLAQLAMA